MTLKNTWDTADRVLRVRAPELWCIQLPTVLCSAIALVALAGLAGLALPIDSFWYEPDQVDYSLAAIVVFVLAIVSLALAVVILGKAFQRRRFLLPNRFVWWLPRCVGASLLLFLTWLVAFFTIYLFRGQYDGFSGVDWLTQANFWILAVATLLQLASLAVLFLIGQPQAIAFGWFLVFVTVLLGGWILVPLPELARVEAVALAVLIALSLSSCFPSRRLDHASSARLLGVVLYYVMFPIGPIVIAVLWTAGDLSDGGWLSVGIASILVTVLLSRRVERNVRWMATLPGSAEPMIGRPSRGASVIVQWRPSEESD
jgi:hypothetical protein